MDSLHIIYHAETNIKKGEPVYDKNGKIIGYYTGYTLRPTYKSNGGMQIKLKENSMLRQRENSENIWISGECVFIHGFGVKFVENYDIL